MSVLPSVLNVKAVVATFNQENALVGLFRDYKPLNLTAGPGQPEPPQCQTWLKVG